MVEKRKNKGNTTTKRKLVKKTHEHVYYDGDNKPKDPKQCWVISLLLLPFKIIYYIGRGVMTLIGALFCLSVIFLVGGFIYFSMTEVDEFKYDSRGEIYSGGSSDVIRVDLDKHELNPALLYALLKASKDDKIKKLEVVSGAIAGASPSGLSYQLAYELRDIALEFKKQKKKTKFIFDDHSGIIVSRGLLASGAFDEIQATPGAVVGAQYPNIRSNALGGGFEKFGIDSQWMRSGAYKSYPASMSQDEIGPYEKEMLKEQAKSYKIALMDVFAQDKRISKEEFDYAQEKVLLLGEQAIKYRWIDKLDFYVADQGKPPIDAQHYMYKKVASDKDDYHDAIGLVSYFSHVIGVNDWPTKEFVKQLKNLDKRKNVKAIVLAISTDGGLSSTSVYLSKILKSLSKPVVTFVPREMSSAGYVFGSANSYIIANPFAFIGSIGNFGGKRSSEEFWKKYFDVNYYYFGTEDPYLVSDVFGFSEKQKEALQESLGASMKEIVGIIAQNRSLGKDQIKYLANGRVWVASAPMTIKEGLIDQLGTFKDALNKAAALGNIKVDKDKVVPVVFASDGGTDDAMLYIKKRVDDLIGSSVEKAMRKWPLFVEDASRNLADIVPGRVVN